MLETIPVPEAIKSPSRIKTIVAHKAVRLGALVALVAAGATVIARSEMFASEEETPTAP